MSFGVSAQAGLFLLRHHRALVVFLPFPRTATEETGAERLQDSKAKKGGRARHLLPLLEKIKSQREEQARNKKGRRFLSGPEAQI